MTALGRYWGIWESTTPWCGRLIPTTDGAKRSESGIDFIPHASYVSINQIPGAVDSLSRWPIKACLTWNTAIPVYPNLSHISHSNQEEPWSCTAVKRRLFVGQNNISLHQDSNPINMQIYQTQLYRCHCVTFWCHGFLAACIYTTIILE